MSTIEQRAARLLRFYPASWRQRYGEEFEQLLIDEITEQPRCLSRTADVIRSGSLARLTAAGLTGDALDAANQLRSSLITLTCAITAFAAFGLAAWSQLTIGWQWSAPDSRSIGAGMILMSIVVPALAALALLAAGPIGWTLATTLRRQPESRRRLLPPALMFMAGISVLVIGGLHFDHGWPGSGGHPWADQGIVPTAVARFFWASSVWISSYWFHPGALKAFPAEELGWMVASPVALIATLTGAVKTLHRTPLSSRVLAYGARLAVVAAAGMAIFLAGAVCWIVSGSPAPHRLFNVGAIDVAALAVMALSLICAFRAVERGLTALKHRPLSCRP